MKIIYSIGTIYKKLPYIFWELFAILLTGKSKHRLEEVRTTYFHAVSGPFHRS